MSPGLGAPEALWVWAVTAAVMMTSSSGRRGVEESSPPLNFTFTRPSYHVTIPENSVAKTYATADEKMGVVLPARGEVHFKIVSGDSDKIFKAEERAMGNFLFLLIRTRTGNSVVLNRERKDSFVLHVKAILTLSDRTVENNTIINLHVSDRNDLRPLFYQTSYQVAVAEDAHVHSSIIQIRADDPDLGIGGEVYYRMREHSSNFVIHPITGVVTLTRRLRYTERRSYDVTVLAQDRGDAATTNPPSAAKLTVTVKPVNLHDPEIFVKHFQEVNQSSDMNVYAVVTVVDKDERRNGEIEGVEIVDGDNNGHFRIKRVHSPNNNTFEYNIVSYKILIRERYSKQYNLTLRAVDKGTPPRKSYLSVIVRVEPIFQKNPIFEKEIFEINIAESAPVNSPIIRLKMSESDQVYHEEVQFEIVGGNEEKVFKINPQTGMLYTTTELDAEDKNLYILTVSALEQGKSGFSLQSSAKVKINIVDINDNDPIFEVPVMNVSVTENEPPGTVIAKVVAKDRDSGENGYISYSIANLNSVPFEIDHFTGVIRTIETLDYETMRRESLLYVRASDWGLPFRRQTEMELRIKLRDINDNKPQFERVNCSGSLSRYSPIGSEVMSLTAIDFDSGNIISYRIVSKNTEGCFNLDLTSGILSLACDLRNENFTEKTLNITATDGVHYSDINRIIIKIVNDIHTRRRNFDSDNFVCTETGAAKQLKDILAIATKNNAVKSPDHRDISVMPKRYGENIHAPEILNMPATVQVNESVPLGSKIIKIQAKDRDLGYNGKLVYGVISGDKDSLFRLDPENGILKTIGHLDYEKDTEYTLNVVVFDLGKPQKSSTSYLTIIVLDNNDNPPRFQQPMASTKISENISNGTAIFKAIAIDQDTAENSQIVYSLATETDTFVIHPTTGVLYINTPPDREVRDCYEIKIRASDRGNDKESRMALHAESILLVHVDDVNDNAPLFVKPSLTVKVKEDMPVGSSVAVLEASDVDLGVNGEVVYSIRGNHSFAVEPLSGALRLKYPLDYEERHVHLVNVTACDRVTPSLCTDAVVTVRVVDVDENVHAPVFEHWAVSAEVAENLPPGALVTVVKATDDDPPGEDSRISYHIGGGDGVGYFSIDDDGVIRTTSTLDAESENNFWLTVFAQDHGLVPLRNRLEVYVSVTNVNDNVPLTVEPVYYPHVVEHSPAHTAVLQLTAEDADLDPDLTSTLTFNITAGNGEGFFEIDYQTGLLSTTRNKIDREYQAEHDLEITVSDNGEPPLWSTTRVVVIVDDINDHAPQFEQSFYHVIVPQTPRLHRDRDKHNTVQIEDNGGAENGDSPWDSLHKAATGEPLIRVLATDKDSGSNADIEYSIKTGRGKGRFHIHPEMGVIYSHKPFSVGQEFELMVRATDHGFPNKSSTARIVVQVVGTSEAKGAPFVAQKTQRVEVTESDPVGFLVALIQATQDADYLWFKILDGNPRGEFVMGGDPGSLLLAKQLDCETQAEYNLTVAVTNGVHSVLAQVIVNVLDINEHRPEFPQVELWAVVSEAASVGSVVTVVQGSDADRGGSVVYELHNAQSPATLTIFALEHETGRLILTGPLDRERNVEHVMTVVAKDNGTPSKRNYARLRVTVEDSNNHAPQWSHQLIQGYVLESAQLGSTVLTLLATDKDHGNNAQIRYSILSGNIGNTFQVHQSLGTLSLSGTVDQSRLSEFMLTVQAKDGGEPPLSTTVPVHILVITADETAPRFTQRSYTVQIYENERAGSLVEHLDVRASSSVFFEIVEGDANHEFAVNPSTGSVTTLVPLDRELTESYNLTVTATNSGGSKAVCNLLVNVLDKNDNPPELVGPTDIYVGLVPEDAPVGSLVMTNGSSPLIIYATDADTQSNALLWFKILETAAASMFYIDGFTGTIRTKTQLDYETLSSVSFTVRVFDLGEPRLSSDVTARVYIAIQDVNDCMPRFVESEYNLSLLVPPYPDAHLLQVAATDDDTAGVTELRYMILAGNQDSWFSLQPVSGLLSVRGVLPAQHHHSHSLRVAVSDGRYSAQARVNIQWLDSGSSHLQFQHPVYQGYVTENSTKPVTVAVVSVVGEELNQHIRFRMANPTPLFHLGLTSGALVTTGVPFDREDKDLFTIYIQAEYEYSDDTKQLIQTLVNISVVDVNDNCPVFMNTPYVVAVSVGSHKHMAFFKVLAIDLDEGENGEVRYELTRGHGELFKVDRKSGEISLKQALQDTQEAYIIIITAYDGGVTPCSTETTLVVKVVAESSPRFERQLYTVTVPESLPPHSLLPVRVVAEAPFDHPVTYAILDNDLRFSIDVTAGALFTEDVLDYETSPLLEIRVRATDSLSGATADTLVTVVLTDVNDCVPTFLESVYNVSLLESIAPGTLIGRIEAFDNDTGVRGAVQYSVAPPPLQCVVSVHTRDVSVTYLLYRSERCGTVLCGTSPSTMCGVKGAVQYSVAPPPLHGVVSVDTWMYLYVLSERCDPVLCGTSTSTRCSQYLHTRCICMCCIGVRGAIQYSVAPPPLHGVVRVRGSIQYSVASLPLHGVVSVDSQDGSVYLSQTLDRELNSTFQLVLTATDGGLPKLSSSAILSLHVLDVNDNPPKFERPTYSCRLSAEAVAGQMVTVVHAKDPDIGPLSYVIVAGNEHHTFSINPLTGMISVFNILHLARPEPPHVLNVSVTDGVHTRFCKVSINILLTNQHAPVFSANQVEASVGENQPAGTYVTTVIATDQDSGLHGKISYYITTELMRSLFKIDTDTGVMVTAVPLDREHQAMVEVAVVAVDGGGRSDIATVRVAISDVNDNAPEFYFPEYHVCIPTNLSIDSVFLKVKARDKDTGTAGVVEYSIYNLQSKRVKHLFGINPQTGSIVLLQSVAQHERQHFQFFVRAADGGAPPLFSDVAVNVYVMRPEDTPPTFHRRDQRVFVPEHAPPGTVVAQVKLVTPMIVEYKLLSNSTQFSIDSKGLITLTSALDRELSPSHTLGVLALKSPLSGFTEMYVNVVDINDNPPRFHSSTYNIRVAENVNEGTSIVRVSASDDDEGGAGEVRYSIASPVLTVDPYSGWVSVVSDVPVSASTIVYLMFQCQLVMTTRVVRARFATPSPHLC
ncbi:fat-like cadherin-related tumor suppressor homolog [Macrosteles quadrilineatus]|uniref:fat-like cadherin-related tumor suppressor homolog n=1 Tax=Macrosteles quadrilineatus TaxID=74068 RepID=UPI0023E24669|nr:fat-like cadherin-related tumor suppressor homolog [Macrosteles quadrilineatus]